jgi:3-hydroxyanthranilate 3,4-dioxygenase
MFGMKEAFEWYCFECEALVHRVEVALTSAAGIVDQLPGIYDAFHADKDARKCGNCGSVHPGKGAPPDGWLAP